MMYLITMEPIELDCARDSIIERAPIGQFVAICSETAIKPVITDYIARFAKSITQEDYVPEEIFWEESDSESEFVCAEWAYFRFFKQLV